MMTTVEFKGGPCDGAVVTINDSEWDEGSAHAFDGTLQDVSVDARRPAVYVRRGRAFVFDAEMTRQRQLLIHYGEIDPPPDDPEKRAVERYHAKGDSSGEPGSAGQP